MPTVIALTGGIATGKSTCCRLFLEKLPETVIFDADACVSRLYQSPEVLEALEVVFGSEVRLPHGGVNKPYLRNRAFKNREDQRALEKIFHPRVIEECLALLAETTRNASSRLFIADIPLLFEGGFDLGQSTNLLLATSRATQVNRLKKRNAWDDEIVNAVLKSQMPIESKLGLADVVFWNEGPIEVLDKQICRFLTTTLSRSPKNYFPHERRN